MEIFISWSGNRSQSVAKDIAEWLQGFFPWTKPWISTGDIPAGSKWADEMQEQLAESRFGLICLTRSNLRSPWLHYETGALATKLEPSRVCPYLIDISPKDLKEPFKWFQSVEANRDGTWKLVKEIHGFSKDDQGGPEWLEKAFEVWWPNLAKKLSASSQPSDNKSVPAEPMEDVLADVREVVREILAHLQPRYSGFDDAIEFFSRQLSEANPVEEDNALIQRAFDRFSLPPHIARTALVKARTTLALKEQESSEADSDGKS